MNKEEIIKQTAEHVKAELSGAGHGHDWWHIYRVWQNAIHIGKLEQADLFVVELAALLHDIGDYKLHGGEDKGEELAREWLEGLAVEKEIVDHVCSIVKNVGFKGGIVNNINTLEGKVVQDADRLDAIGAIGIARTFAYGGVRGNEMHDPDSRPVKYESFEQYKNSKSTTINHFYEKLLLLKDRMNTETAKKIAKKRHEIMEEFLKNFFLEWDPERQ